MLEWSIQIDDNQGQDGKELDENTAFLFLKVLPTQFSGTSAVPVGWQKNQETTI